MCDHLLPENCRAVQGSMQSALYITSEQRTELQ